MIDSEGIWYLSGEGYRYQEDILLVSQCDYAGIFFPHRYLMIVARPIPYAPRPKATGAGLSTHSMINKLRIFAWKGQKIIIFLEVGGGASYFRMATSQETWKNEFN